MLVGRREGISGDVSVNAIVSIQTPKSTEIILKYIDMYFFMYV